MKTSKKKIIHLRRIATLMALTTAPFMAIAQTNTKPKGEFVLFFNQDPVCANFTRNLNQFRHLEYDACHPRLSPKYPEFSRPDWREVPLDVGIAEKAFGKSSWQKWQKEVQPSLVRKDMPWPAWSERVFSTCRALPKSATAFIPLQACGSWPSPRCRYGA
jgi:hypothetical protein